ncbi:MAG: hypothetical protein JWL76_2299 [Thermoleophilia bacterium]|nr:hypothetical protein [Thermoleophilia bacterium]
MPSGMSLAPTILLVLAGILAILLLRSVKTVRPGTVAIIERLGRFSRVAQPGTHLLVPVVDNLRTIVPMDERLVVLEDEPLVTDDNFVLLADVQIAVVIEDPVRATYEVADAADAVRQLAVATLRAQVGSVNAEDALARDRGIVAALLPVVGAGAATWGMRLVSVDGSFSRQPG